MRILYAFYNDGSPMFQWQISHIVGEMQLHDCVIEIINPANYCDVESFNKAILESINLEQYDIFMTCLTDKHIFVATLENISIKKILEGQKK